MQIDVDGDGSMDKSELAELMAALDKLQSDGPSPRSTKYGCALVEDGM